MSVALSALRLGRKLGDGGQSEVFLVENRPGLAFKRYRPEALQSFRPDVLEELVSETGNLTLEGKPIIYWATWPTQTVTDGSRVIGFLMPRLSDAFFFSEGNLHAKPATFAYLACRPAPFWGDVSLPGMGERLTLLEQLAGILQQLHSRRMVVGDISWSNALWTRVPKSRVILLDCDGIRPPGGVPVARQLDSPDWTDPLAPPDSAPDADRDCYKFALMVLRVLSQSLTARVAPQVELELPEQSSETRRAITELLRRAAGERGRRPTATDWRFVLDKRPAHKVNVPVPRSRETLATLEKPRTWLDITPLARASPQPQSPTTNGSSPQAERRYTSLKRSDDEP